MGDFKATVKTKLFISNRSPDEKHKLTKYRKPLCLAIDLVKTYLVPKAQ